MLRCYILPFKKDALLSSCLLDNIQHFSINLLRKFPLHQRMLLNLSQRYSSGWTHLKHPLKEVLKVFVTSIMVSSLHPLHLLTKTVALRTLAHELLLKGLLLIALKSERVFVKN